MELFEGKKSGGLISRKIVSCSILLYLNKYNMRRMLT